ncbi:MAG TPA: hypothetical protein VF441_05705 [Acidimicrobiia bacterium]
MRRYRRVFGRAVPSVDVARRRSTSQHRSGYLLLAGSRDFSPAAVGGEDRHLVIAHVKPDLGPGDVVDDDRVQSLSLELAASVLDRAGTVLGGEPDRDLAAGATLRDAAEHVGRRLELDRRRPVVLLGLRGGPDATA